MPRTLILALGVLCVFVVVAAILLRLMPGPLKDTDYLVAGSVATVVALLVLFLGLRSPGAFYKKRRKQ